MFVAESKRLTYQGAKKIMATAVELATQAKIAISCTIVDAGGHVILVERMDGGRPRPKARPVRTSTSATRSALRSPPDRTGGRRWKGAYRCWSMANASPASA
jgi:uncharacterized protein GlcG (DUF336 family)